MIEDWAGRLAANIKRSVPEHPASYAVLKYALSVILNVVSIVSITLLVSMLTGRTKEAVLILISFALLRQASGGVHIKSGTLCVLVTTALFTLISYIRLADLYAAAITAVSLVIILWLAPIDIDRQTRIPKRHWSKLKVVAALFVMSNFFIGSSVVALSYLAQSLSLMISFIRIRKEGKGFEEKTAA